MLLFPEGDRSRRRHAHTACVMRARERGRLPTHEEWVRAQPGYEPPVGLWRRVLSRWRAS